MRIRFGFLDIKSSGTLLHHQVTLEPAGLSGAQSTSTLQQVQAVVQAVLCPGPYDLAIPMLLEPSRVAREPNGVPDEALYDHHRVQDLKHGDVLLAALFKK